MAEARHERLKALLAEAEGVDAPQREAWLAHLRTTEPELAGEIIALLDVPVRPELSGQGLARAIQDALVEGPPPPLDLPRDLGPYRLLELIGHGGMGVVYRAEQTRPFHREVAVKALRGGWRPEELRARIAAERRALALMEHPGIARLYDAIVDENGTPYLVMELVSGQPITDYVRAHPMDTRAVLELFVTACRAVQYAHRRGIIHRDLKPANLLVTQVDGRPATKVIDFGVSRLMAEDDADTRLTRAGQVVGTIDYMSPEQAIGNATEADTRSDVYSLGVVLFELLSGRHPHELAGLGGHEAVRRIAQGVARPLRQAAGRARKIAPELEAIVHKALEREPERRYEGPGALADDLERLLRNDPVTARPPSAAYQLRVLVRRHRVAVVAGAALLLVLVLFGATMSVLYRGQVRERERAGLEAAKAAAINRFLVGVLESPDPEHGLRNITVHDLLDAKLAALPAEFGQQPEVMAEVQATLGRTYSGLGEYARADSLLGLALAMSRTDPRDPGRTIQLLLDLAKNAQRDGQFTDSRERATEAAELAHAWGRREPRAADEAAALQAVGLATIGEAMLSEGKDPARTEAALLEAVAIERRLRPSGSPGLAEALLRLGRFYWSAGPWERADSLLRESLAISERVEGPGHPRQLEILTNLGLVQRLLRHPEEGERLTREVVERTRRMYGPDHPAMAPPLNNLASIVMESGRQPEAESLLVVAIGLFDRSTARYHEDMSAAYKNLAHVMTALDDTASMNALAWKAIRVSEDHNGPGHWLEIQPRCVLAHALCLRGRHAEAVRELRDAVDLNIRHRGAESVRTLDTIKLLAYALLGAGEVDSARALARHLSVRQPGNEGTRTLVELTAPPPDSGRSATARAFIDRISSTRHWVRRHFAGEVAVALAREGDRAGAARIRRELAAGSAALRTELRPRAHAQALAIARAARSGEGEPRR